MARVEVGGIHIRSEKDIEKILGQAEKEFARLIRTRPHLLCWYESTRFEHQNGGPFPETTIPDFRIINTRSGAEVFVEITTSAYKPDADPKGKQKRVMQNAAEDDGRGYRYVVLYAEHLLRVQTANPGYKLLGHYTPEKSKENGR